MPAEEEGGQDVSGRKMQFLNMQNVIPLQEGTIQHGRSDISTSPFRFLLLMENFYHSLCGFQHHKVITLQLFRAEGQHSVSRPHQGANKAALFSGSSGENLVPCLFRLLEAAHITWFLAPPFPFEARQGR